MSTAPVVDEQAHRDVIAPLLGAQLGMDPVGRDPEGRPAQRVYDYGKVPGANGNQGTLPAIYVLITVERRYVAPMRAGRAGRSAWRVTCRYVGRTVDEARWAANRVTLALDEVELQIGGRRSTPITHESTTTVEPDEGRFSGLSTWTYVL